MKHALPLSGTSCRPTMCGNQDGLEAHLAIPVWPERHQSGDQDRLCPIWPAAIHDTSAQPPPMRGEPPSWMVTHPLLSIRQGYVVHRGQTNLTRTAGVRTRSAAGEGLIQGSLPLGSWGPQYCSTEEECTWRNSASAARWGSNPVGRPRCAFTRRFPEGYVPLLFLVFLSRSL